MSTPGVTPDVELDMKDVELNEMDTEKQPMNASSPLASSPGSLGEKNGAVMVKVTEEKDRDTSSKFTGLSKEELLEVAGTPAWVRTRWALLILFWLGWLGMLAGAIVIIVQAPRCKDLPKQEWWQKGGIYRIQKVEGFQDSASDGVGDLAGLKQRMDYLSSLKVKGLVLGPLHVNPKDNQAGTNLQNVDTNLGTLAEFRDVLQAAKKKSLKIILDLTPNYRGESPWFSQQIYLNYDLQEKMKEAIEFWLKEGVSGIQIGSVEHLNDTQILNIWKNLTEQYAEDHARVLIAVTKKQDAHGIFTLLNETTGVDVLTSDYLMGLAKSGQEDTTRGKAASNMITNYIKAAGDKWAGWSVARPNFGRLDNLGEQFLRLYHMLLYTLPGTPFTDYGDEIGLRDLPGQPATSNVTRMQWDNSANFGFSKGPEQPGSQSTSNATVQLQSGDTGSVLTLFQQLSDLRGKERSLLHGEFSKASSTSPSVFSYLRIWDQNKRFLVVLNFAAQETTVSVSHPHLPPEVTVELSTNPSREEEQLSVQDLKLGPLEGLLLSYIYVA
ncbi:4F2 cell-surface antigen heavy chain isoform X2 [Sceloporus undulatus]|nr:4F2 cell-surface antigen heavy chain isoform X2 [Sceloporus undulatus]